MKSYNLYHWRKLVDIFSNLTTILKFCITLQIMSYEVGGNFLNYNKILSSLPELIFYSHLKILQSQQTLCKGELGKICTGA